MNYVRTFSGQLRSLHEAEADPGGHQRRLQPEQRRRQPDPSGQPDEPTVSEAADDQEASNAQVITFADFC